MKITLLFQTQENAALFAEASLKRVDGCALTVTTGRIPLGDYFVTLATGSLDGTTQLAGCEKPQTILMPHRYSASCHCEDCKDFRIEQGIGTL